MTTNERIYPPQTCAVCGRRFRFGGLVKSGTLACPRCIPSLYDDTGIEYSASISANYPSNTEH